MCDGPAATDEYQWNVFQKNYLHNKTNSNNNNSNNLIDTAILSDKNISVQNKANFQNNMAIEI